MPFAVFFHEPLSPFSPFSFLFVFDFFIFFRYFAYFPAIFAILIFFRHFSLFQAFAAFFISASFISFSAASVFISPIFFRRLHFIFLQSHSPFLIFSCHFASFAYSVAAPSISPFLFATDAATPIILFFSSAS